MKFAYADPPYPGQAHRLYGREEVDHGTLIQQLITEYSDGWALSTAARSLQDVLGFCPPGVRVLAWCKPTSPPFSTRVQFSWEPVLLMGGRPFVHSTGTGGLTRDYLVASPPLYTFRPKPANWVAGAKPPEFCRWILDVLGYEDGDTLDDLFPGTGIMEAVAAQGRIAL